MIEFKGRRSKKIIKAQRIEICKSLVQIVVVVVIFCFATMIGFAVTKSIGELLAVLFMLVLWGILWSIFFATLLSKSSIDKTYRNVWDDVVTISIYDAYFVYKTKKEKYEYGFSKITSVIDCGEYYLFSFKRWKHSGLACQKDWICDGTIEEFEEVFKDKLVRKK